MRMLPSLLTETSAVVTPAPGAFALRENDVIEVFASQTLTTDVCPERCLIFVASTGPGINVGTASCFGLKVKYPGLK